MAIYKTFLKKWQAIILAVCLISTILFSTACSTKGCAVDFVYFNTVIHVETHGSTISNQTEKDLENLFSSLEREFSCSNQSSYTYAINSAGANLPTKVNQRYATVFSLAKEYHDFTNGLFNPAIYPLVKLWQFNDYPVKDFVLPTENQITALTNGALDFDGFSLNANDLSITKTNERLSLDFGGILKGYATDLASQILLDAGHTKGYISVGGSSLFILGVESLGIRHPRATADNSLIISVNLDSAKNIPVSTSGDYEKYYILDGKNYNHILHSQTGYPTDTGVISATITGVSGAFGDAITTAMCLMSHQNSSTNSNLILFMKKIIAQNANCGIYAVYLNGESKEIITNKKQGEDFTLLDESYLINQI